VIRSLFAIALAAVFCTNAFADDYCDLAEQLTQPTVSPECRAVFLNIVTNEQDKIDMRRFFESWKAPADLEISNFGSILQVQVGQSAPLNMMFVSQEPLMVIVNDKVYTDVSSEKSWSRRYQKIFAEARNAAKTADLFPLSPLLFGPNANADLPPDPTDQVGHAFAVVNSSGVMIKGNAQDVIAKLDESEGFAPNYTGGFFETVRGNIGELLNGHQERIRNEYHNEISCDAKGNVKDGRYRFLGNKGIIARVVGKDEIAVKGLLSEGREVKIKLNPRTPKGEECADKHTSGNKDQCQKTWKELVKSHPKLAAEYKKMTKHKRKPKCSAFTTNSEIKACKAYFAKHTKTKGEDEDADYAVNGKSGPNDAPDAPNGSKVIKYDDKHFQSLLSICKEGSADCSESEPIKTTDLAKLADPTNSWVTAPSPKPLVDAPTSPDADAESPQKPGSEKPTKGHHKNKKSQAVDPELPPSDVADADKTSPFVFEGHSIKRDLERIAVGMELYSSCCASSQCRESVKPFMGAKGTVFNKDQDGEVTK